MIRFAAIVAIGFFAASPALSAGGPSFSCAAARTQVERAICADPTLAGLDLSLEGAFRQALAEHHDARQDLLDEQRRWVSGRGR